MLFGVNARRLPSEFPCAQCGYDLRGKEHDDHAKCPECGTSVAESKRLNALHDHQNARTKKAVIIAILIAATIGIIWFAFSVDKTCGRFSLALIVALPLRILFNLYATPMNYRWPYR